MVKIILLHDRTNGEPIYINTEKIKSFTGFVEGGGTYIALTEKDRISVRENPNEVYNQVNNKK